MALKHLLLGGLAATVLAGQAMAAVPDAVSAKSAGTDRSIYQPADFSQYGPVTALDMVRRIPGFAIVRDDSGNRGFGQARGNVLINGQRVSAKSNGAEVALGRVAAARVVRIEVLDGTQTDIPGLTGKVVNVVTDGEGTVDGTWRYKIRLRENLPPSLNEGTVTLAGSKGPLSWTFEADSSPQRSGDAGWRQIEDGNGVLLERRREDFTRLTDDVSLAGSLSWKPASGAIGNLNAKVGIWEVDGKQISKTYPEGGAEGRRLFRFAEDEWNAEIGGDYELDAGPGRLKFIGLARREHSPFIDRFEMGAFDGTGLYASNFEQTVDEGEYILRSEYALQAGEGRDWQISAEGAFNYLDAEAALEEASGGGPLVEVPLDLANSRVEERRGEITLTHGRQLTPKLNLQLSGGLEYSELEQSGDAENKRNFTRPKGFASLSWQKSDTLKLVGKVERRVGQLNFYDFISSVDLDLGNGQSGNKEIVPSQSWRYSLEAQKGLGAWGASTLRFLYVDLEDVVDQVPIGNGAGPGNIDSATAYGIETETTLKLAPLGLKGAEITATGRYFDTEADDPVTGIRRSINGHLIWDYNIELRQDVPNTDVAWGLVLEGFKQEPFYQLSDTQLGGNEPAFLMAYLEHKDIAGMTGTVAIGNLTNQKDTYWRRVYGGDRTGPLVRTEEYSRAFGPIFTMELKGKF
ncbi:TonB-dependent receptor plug domain-containing protein [Hyphomonas sp. WL0036]|uniref:TonB-dependent receptor plug domain-containing protein n=1 Tax=Hyphomonas sediminis TaxID=2866160 RepID=UPI001C81F84A|nr:TonB-dependent receptor plug domain-containing protein [Hyphomonas sediminis]MBY9065623.1 TonB-dependent receptor plug domain-containing protein [Hyphomonas sediminis]